MSSDKENDEPQSRETTPRPAKRGLRDASARMPTPDSGATPGTNGSKRRRTGTYSEVGTGIYEDEAEEEQDEESQEEDAPSQAGEDEQGPLKYYNPNQDPDERRRLRATLRDHQRMVEGKSCLASRFHGQH